MKKGKLYLVSTPIGNLKDITLRALEILKEVDVILAEDTRVSIKLLNHYEIKKKMIALHKFNELEKLSNIENLLKEGYDLALISDAGTPMISDPGVFIVPKLLKKGFDVIPVPGATALIPAVQLSGIVKDKFLFMGFFPSSNKEFNELLSFLDNIKDIPLFFYESPHKINSSLKKLYENFGNIDVVIFREITKKYEERIEAKVLELLNKEFRGEIVFSFKLESKKVKDNNKEIKELYQKYKNIGFSKKDCAKIISLQLNEKKNKVYNILLGEK